MRFDSCGYYIKGLWGGTRRRSPSSIGELYQNDRWLVGNLLPLKTEVHNSLASLLLTHTHAQTEWNVRLFIDRQEGRQDESVRFSSLTVFCFWDIPLLASIHFPTLSTVYCVSTLLVLVSTTFYHWHFNVSFCVRCGVNNKCSLSFCSLIKCHTHTQQYQKRLVFKFLIEQPKAELEWISSNYRRKFYYLSSNTL
jgi:hypothetical protein